MNTSATVVIPTFNRKDSLRDALRSCFTQTVPVEVVVMDDGSTDGTDEMMRRDFSHVRYQRHAGPNGPAFLRNRGSALAQTPMLLPIDDDAVFVSPRTVEQTLAEFDNPRVGAVAIPFINVRRDNIIRQQAPDSGRIYVTDAYVGAAHAIRRDRFLAAGGYRPRLFYMGEEGDLCIRMLNRGWVVRLGRADPMHHHESPLRVNRRADIYGRRNDVLFAWHNVPLPYFPLHLIATTFNGLRMGRRVGRLGTMAQGLALGFASIAREIAERRPVSRRTYRLSRMLKKRGVVPLEEIEPLLGPIAESS